MEKDLIFFGENGITDTKANSVADMAKLSYTDELTYLESLSFIDESVETINGENKKEVSYGVKDLSNVADKLQRVGDLKSLCAWLREAVSAHQRLLSEIDAYTFKQYMADNNIELGEAPKMEKELTEDDVIGLFDVKKRNRYYYLETQASTIGLLIHKNGQFDTARKVYYNKLSHPRYMASCGQDIIIYTYTPSVSKEELENTFNNLQQKHQEYQSELNSIKSEIKSRITNDSIEKKQRFENSSKEFLSKENDIYNEYSSWKAREAKRIANLKIIIPNSLKPIFDEITSLVNKK